MKTFIAHEIPTLKRVDGPNGRVYQTPTGKAYPSVTSVTGLMGKDDFFAWRARVGEEEANRVSARAARRGTAIHSLCEDYLYGKNPVPTMFDAQVFNSIRPHLDLIDNIHALESKLYSDHLQVAGTVDCIAEYKGKRAVIDFKTSKRIKEAKDISGYFMQTAAYAVAFEERTGIAIPRLVIIMGIDDEDPIIFEEKRDNWIDSFISLREEYRLQKGV
jgi:genome maintenance exonuclease 1